MVHESIDDKLLQTFKASQPTVKIEDVRDVASYSWTNSSHPKILVPGLPPRWTPPHDKPQLQEDSGEYYRDPNAARYAEFPMQPAIQSVLWQRTPNVADEIRIFACGSTLANLIRFIRQTAKTFCFRVEIIGKTAFFVRKEKSPTDLIEGVYGYGHTFPEAYTTWDKSVAASESHQKIIRYSFGSKDMMVRFEADGYLPEKANNSPGSVHSRFTTNNLDPDDFLSELESLRTKPIAAGTGSLEVATGGHQMPQSAIFDLKTRSIKKCELDILGQELPRLWINQIPNFILAFHTRGKFNHIRIQDVRSRVRHWEMNHQKELQIFSGLLDHICEAAERAEGGKLEVSYGTEHGLQLKSVDPESWSVLPDDLKAQWLDA